MPFCRPDVPLIALPSLPVGGACDLSQLTMQIFACLGAEGVCKGTMPTYSPLTGEQLVWITPTAPHDVAQAVALSQAACQVWRNRTLRAALIYFFAQGLRVAQAPLAQLIVIETGKRLDQALAEIDQMIADCEGAVESTDQTLVGPVGVVSAFNVSPLVWVRKAALAIVAGNSVIWAPSEKTPLTALACQAILQTAIAQFGDVPDHLSQVLVGGPQVAEALMAHPLVLCLSDAGLQTTQGVVTPLADQGQAVLAVMAAVVGMAGQGALTLRELFVHRDIYPSVLAQLIAAYEDLSIGNPLQTDALVGPLIDREAYEALQQALQAARACGATVHGGTRQMIVSEAAYYLRPALVEGAPQAPLNTPILYLRPYDDLSLVIADGTAPLGIFTQDPAEAKRALALAKGRIAKINLCPSLF